MASYDGRQVVGIDLHRRRTVIVRMTGDGRKLETSRITNSPQVLRAEIAKAGQAPQVVVEAAYGWYWAADVRCGELRQPDATQLLVQRLDDRAAVQSHGPL
jgi:hypothetical protein